VITDLSGVSSDVGRPPSQFLDQKLVYALGSTDPDG